MPDAAVIFDVDGVLLDLTGPEEDAFFAPFEGRHGLTGLSRDWDSYRVRNDEDIIREILGRHFGRDASPHEVTAHLADYIGSLEAGYAAGHLAVRTIPGADTLLGALSGSVRMGIATANLARAAEIRLERAGLWNHVRAHAEGADGGGAKREVLRRLLARMALPASRVVYVGDNLNDLDAGLANGVSFIGFALEPARRDRLRSAGASTVSGDHDTTLALIRDALRLA